MKRIILPIDGKNNIVKSKLLKTIFAIEQMKEVKRSGYDSIYFKYIELGKDRKATYQVLYQVRDYYDIEIEKTNKVYDSDSINHFKFYAKPKDNMITDDVLFCSSLYEKYKPYKGFKNFEVFSVLSDLIKEDLFEYDSSVSLYRLKDFRKNLSVNYYYFRSRLLSFGVLIEMDNAIYLNDEFTIWIKTHSQLLILVYKKINLLLNYKINYINIKKGDINENQIFIHIKCFSINGLC